MSHKDAKELADRMEKWAEVAPVAQRSELMIVMKAWAQEVRALEQSSSASVLEEILSLTRLPDADWLVRKAIQNRVSKALGLVYDPQTDKFVKPAQASGKEGVQAAQKGGVKA